MKKFGKIILAMVAGLVMATAFISCGKKECDLCGEMKSVSKYTTYGVTVEICKDCKAELKAAEKLLNSFGY